MSAVQTSSVRAIMKLKMYNPVRYDIDRVLVFTSSNTSFLVECSGKDFNQPPRRNNAIFDCPFVGNKHARFSMTPHPDNAILIEDIGLGDGVFVNGVKLRHAERKQVYDGDHIMIDWIRMWNSGDAALQVTVEIDRGQQPLKLATPLCSASQHKTQGCPAVSERTPPVPVGIQDGCRKRHSSLLKDSHDSTVYPFEEGFHPLSIQSADKPKQNKKKRTNTQIEECLQQSRDGTNIHPTKRRRPELREDFITPSEPFPRHDQTTNDKSKDNSIKGGSDSHSDSHNDDAIHAWLNGILDPSREDARRRLKSIVATVIAYDRKFPQKSKQVQKYLDKYLTSLEVFVNSADLDTVSGLSG